MYIFNLVVLLYVVIAGTSPSLSSGGGSYARCDNMAVFIRLLQKVAADRGLPNTTLYIVRPPSLHVYNCIYIVHGW